MENLENQNVRKEEEVAPNMKKNGGKNKALIVTIIILLLLLVASGITIAVLLLKPNNKEVSSNNAEDNIIEQDVNSVAQNTQEKELVTDAFFYDGNVMIDNGILQQRTYKIPKINIDSADVKIINDEINEKIVKKAKATINKEKGAEDFLYSEVNYEYFVNGETLSVLITVPCTEFEGKDYYSYNVNINTGKRISNDELIKLKNITNEKFIEEIMAEANSNFLKSYGTVDEYINITSGTDKDEDRKFYSTQYSKVTNKENYKVDNQILYLNKEGNLIAIVASYHLAGSDEGMFDIITVDGKYTTVQNSSNNTQYNSNNNQLVTDASYKTYKNSVYRIPKINIQSSYAKQINNEINERFKGYSDGNWIAVKSIGYEYFINNDIISVSIKYVYDGDLVNYYIYNINKTTGEKVTNEEIIKELGLTSTKFSEKLKVALKDHFIKKWGTKEDVKHNMENAPSGNTKEEVEEHIRFYEQQYNNTISDSHCNVKNCKVYLNGNKELMVCVNEFALAGSNQSEYIINLNEI